MKETNNNIVYNALIYIISCCLSGKRVDKDLLSHVELGSIYSAASRQSLIAIIATALEDAGVFSQRASDMKLNAARKNMLFDSARAEILAELEKQGIKYMPLKGVIMKDLYPAVGLRQMADNDILFDKKYRSAVRDIMVSLGYMVKLYEVSNQDVYMKEPVLNFEMHVSLYSPKGMSVLYNYYKDAFDKAKKDDKSNFGYSFSDEDFYVYLKSHEYKHFSNCGTGLRSLVDTFVFINAKSASLDMDYITGECEKIGIADYEAVTRRIALTIFDPSVAESLVKADRGLCELPISIEDIEFLDSFVDSSTYGSPEKYLSNIIARERKNTRTTLGAKLKYLGGRIFPPMEIISRSNPKLVNKKYLYPFLWIKRAFVLLFTRPVNTLKIIGRVLRTKVNKKGKYNG